MTMRIDSHVHLLPKRVRDDRAPFCVTDKAFGGIYASTKARLASEEDIIEYLDRQSIDKAVVFGFPWESHDLVRLNNEEVWDFHAAHPDRIIPFATLSSRGGERAWRETQRTLCGGFAGLGELAVYEGGWIAERLDSFSACLSTAAEAHAPVMFHVNEPIGHHYPGKTHVDFEDLLDTIADHPGVDFILAHWGGGIFFYALMPEVAQVLQRTFVDTAASPFLYRPAIYRVGSLVLGPEKILFGSDFPLLSLKRYQREMDEAGIDDRFRRGILGENARRLLRLEDSLVNREAE